MRGSVVKRGEGWPCQILYACLTCPQDSTGKLSKLSTFRGVYNTARYVVGCPGGESSDRDTE